MDGVANPEERQQRSADGGRPLVFLDASVIVGYLQGESSAAQLFAAEANGRIRIAVNPIVLQELLLTEDIARRPEFERIRKHLRVLPLDFAKAEALVPRIRALRTRLAHSNDVLILSSADECDFLVTSRPLKDLVAAQKPEILTPEEFATRLRAA
jgi:predicted nucleic acid-binding protein